MFNKIANVLSIVSFLMVASMSGGAYFGYKYVTSEQFKTKVMNQVMKEVQTILPGQIQKKLPKVTGKSLPCLLYTSPSPRDKRQSRMPSSA